MYLHFITLIYTVNNFVFVAFTHPFFDRNVTTDQWPTSMQLELEAVWICCSCIMRELELDRWQRVWKYCVRCAE